MKTLSEVAAKLNKKESDLITMDEYIKAMIDQGQTVNALGMARQREDLVQTIKILKWVIKN